MEHNVNIQEELRQTAPSLATVSRQMPNGLPDGYFDTLPLELLLKTAPLANLSVPEGYFETLSLDILLKASGRQQASVPAGYFDNFADNMLAKVKALETAGGAEELPPLFKNIGKKTPYSVPHGYFEQPIIPASVQLAAPVTEERAAPVVPIKPRRNYLAWVAAACTIGVVSLLTWQFGLRGTVQPPPSGTIANVVPGTGLLDSSAATMELAAALANVEVNSLEKALSQTTNADQDTHSAVFYLNTDNFESAVKDLSDEELEQYLQESAGVSTKS